MMPILRVIDGETCFQLSAFCSHKSAALKNEH